MRILNGNLTTACQTKSDQNLEVETADYFFEMYQL
jgi:hypothetical protein